MQAKITYYGVRGSIPAVGEPFIKIGGNTTCVFIETKKEKIIIDAGTGIRNLGNDLMKGIFGKGGGKASILFTHTHWDHIQGFPFFMPGYIPNNEFCIYGETKEITLIDEGTEDKSDWDIERALSAQQSFMFFPAATHHMGAKLNFNPVSESELIELSDVKISALTLFHPNSTLGFRFDFKDKTFVFCTDVEHNDSMLDKIGAFAEGADVLAYDCQYTPEEYEDGKAGWGHSTYMEASKIMRYAKAKKLHMIHHDPSHTDDFLFDLEKTAQKEYSNTALVHEGFSFTL